jgi:hypothetical protein
MSLEYHAQRETDDRVVLDTQDMLVPVTANIKGV